MRIKVVAGKYMKYIDLESHGNDTLKVSFPYDTTLLAEIKAMENARWNPEGKFWTVKNSQRNHFAFEYLMGKNPYARFKADPLKIEYSRPLFEHQKKLCSYALSTKQAYWAAEMGLGKTVAAIEVMERSGTHNWLWVGPKSALAAVELELIKWQSKVHPVMVTYDGLKKLIENWPSGKPAFRGVVFDEAQKIKTPTAQRSQAAKYLADSMRKEYGHDYYLILMSGTPAPKSPADWWFPCEVACPGYLKEGTYEKFKRRLGLIVQEDSIVGVSFPKLVTWWDNSDKCAKCGQLKDDINHDINFFYEPNYHIFEESVNEVEKLYKRLSGLVTVQFKKDCLDLPEKHYRLIRVNPSENVKRAAKLVVAAAKNVVSANILLRELSDGFLYQNKEIGEDICPTCNGRKEIEHPVAIQDAPSICDCGGEVDYISDSEATCLSCSKKYSIEYENQTIDCPNCSGEGVVPRFERHAVPVECPKEQVLIDLLEEHEEVGRFAMYAGFTGSVDKCVEICLSKKWNVVRVDGRGWWASWQPNLSNVECLKEFQSHKIDKIVFIGQADAGGLGLTLTRSPSIFFYSNSFSGEARQQAEDRIHRPGMDLNRGATIIDCIHLPTDEKVLESLRAKKKLQSMSLGEFAAALEK